MCCLVLLGLCFSTWIASSVFLMGLFPWYDLKEASGGIGKWKPGRWEHAESGAWLAVGGSFWREDPLGFRRSEKLLILRILWVLIFCSYFENSPCNSEYSYDSRSEPLLILIGRKGGGF